MSAPEPTAEAVFNNPFGSRITPDEVIDTISFFDDWEERYRYIIDLGKQLPDFPDSLKNDDLLVRGCQSQVWLLAREDQSNGIVQLAVDSDALIVRGLAAIVLAAYNGKSGQDIVAFDIEHYFDQLDLLKHLSPTRGNGLRSMVKKIQLHAENMSR
jgi:cysteine desulfuration protein SufE